MIPPPQQCDCLSAVGMSVECLDSYCPSHHKCDHIVKPSCWGVSYINQLSERDTVLSFIQNNLYKIDFIDSDELFDILQLCKSEIGIEELKRQGWTELRQKAGEHP